MIATDTLHDGLGSTKLPAPKKENTVGQYDDQPIDFGPEPVRKVTTSGTFGDQDARNYRRPTKRGNGAVEGYITLMQQFKDRSPEQLKGMLDASNDVDLAVELESEARRPIGFRPPVIDPITDRQRSFLTSLIIERGGLLESIDVDNLAKWEASRMIDFALKAPVAPRSMPTVQVPMQATMPVVGKGYYAITTDEVTKFYYVSERGNLSIQASDDFHRIHNYETRLKVFEAISLDPRGAQELYGQLIGKCGVCGRTLTDEESRALGIGPVCRERGTL